MARARTYPDPAQGAKDSFFTVSIGGHVPTMETHTGKFTPKLCARPVGRVRGFGVNFVEGCEAERRLRRMQRGGAGAAVAECKRRSKVRRTMRAPQPGLSKEGKHEP